MLALSVVGRKQKGVSLAEPSAENSFLESREALYDLYP